MRPFTLAGGLMLAFSAGWIAITVTGWNSTTNSALRRRLAEPRLGDVRVRLGSDELRRGDTLVWFLELTPKEPLRVTGVNATLEMKQTATLSANDRSSDARKSFRGPADRRAAALEEERRVEAGEAVVVPGRFTLPVFWPPFFYATNNEIRWTLRVELRVARGVDWVREVRLDVG